VQRTQKQPVSQQETGWLLINRFNMSDNDIFAHPDRTMGLVYVVSEST